jgi:rubredoxin
MSEENKPHHICPVCGYDHEQESKIPFDTLPSGFNCPACGVEKEWFEEKYIN